MTRRFERFERVGKRVEGEPRVTVQRRGALTFNAAAYTALGRPESIGLLYSRDTREIGMVPASKADKNAYEVRKQSKSESFIISCGAFLKFYGIPESPSRRYSAIYEDDVLIVDLKQESENVDRSREAGMNGGIFDEEPEDAD